jgi:hypothetical protein
VLSRLIQQGIMLFIIALLWLAGIIVAAAGSVAGGLVLARRLGARPLVAIPSGVALGVAALPAFVLGAYLFFLGWPLALVIGVVGGVWHRFVTTVRVMQGALSVTFVIAWLAVTTGEQAAERFGTAEHLLADGAVLLSALAALLILLEVGAIASERLRPAPPASV